MFNVLFDALFSTSLYLHLGAGLRQQLQYTDAFAQTLSQVAGLKSKFAFLGCCDDSQLA